MIKAEAAQYKQQTVPNYQGNPLIEALPPLWTEAEVLEQLPTASYSPDERLLDRVARLHCLHGLFGYFQPLEHHMEIERRLACCIRQGYLGRHPLSAEHGHLTAELFRAGMERRPVETIEVAHSHARGFTILGVSGVGKTTSIEKILSLYPQRIEHTSYKSQTLVLTQIVWLKLDCPQDGSLKGLCLAFFQALDAAAGTDYLEEYSKRNTTIDRMLVIMSALTARFAIGVLVIDEIQHLSEAKCGGSHRMLNFLVTLVNTIGVPIVLIGTSKAVHMLQTEFRQARRSSAMGDIFWDRMAEDASWDIFLEAMWSYQWTRDEVPLTDRISTALYAASQGVTDITVKLYAIVQDEAIAMERETFTAEDFTRLAEKKLHMVRPMLDALRSGNPKLIEKYEDIPPIRMEDCLTFPPPSIKPVSPNTHLPLREDVIIRLINLEMDPDMATRAVGDALAILGEGATVSQVFKHAYGACLAPELPTVETVPASTDLRRIDGHAELKANELIDEEVW